MKVFMGSVLRIFLFFSKQKTAYEILACGVQTCALPIYQGAGARLAPRHLLDLGHRTVHHVTGPADSKEARDRIAGWQAELHTAGAPVREHLRGDWTQIGRASCRERV